MWDQKWSAIFIDAQTGDIEKALEFWRKALEGNKENATLRKKIELKKYIAE